MWWDTITTSTPSLMGVCSSASSITTNSSDDLPQGPSAAQWTLFLPPPLMSWHKVLLASPLCNSSYLSPRCLFRHMPTMPWVLHRWVSLSELSSYQFVCICWYLWWCMLSVFRLHCICHFHLWVLDHWALHNCSPLEHTCGRHKCIMVMFGGPHWQCTKWLLPQLL